MYNEKELKAAFESQYNDQAKVKQTLTDELQDHLNNISMSQDRIEGLLDNLEVRLYGHKGNDQSDETVPDVSINCVASLNGQARAQAIKLNELGDKLAYLVNSL